MFTTHELQEIREGTARFRCRLCKQTWTSSPRSACPGVPVLAEPDPRYKTMTALEKERKYLDWTKPDRAYRIRNAPYYNWLYDEKKAIPRPLTERQQAANEKRRATMRDKYGCRFCDIHYTAKDQERFVNRVCPKCQSHINGWNELVSWACQMVASQALILHLETLPAERPRDDYGTCPPAYRARMQAYFDRASYQLKGYAALELLSGETRFEHEQIETERDLQDLRYLLAPALSEIASAPAVVAPSPFAASIAHRLLNTSAHNPAVHFIPHGYHYHVYRARAWHRVLGVYESINEGQTEREQLVSIRDTLGIPPERAYEPSAWLIRQIILYLAEQEPMQVETALD